MKNTRELNGYIVLYKPDHPFCMTSKNWNGYVYEHKWVVESKLGRKLNKDEVIHHLDGNIKNNRFVNLLVLSRSEHVKLHKWINSGANGLEVFIKEKKRFLDPFLLEKRL